MANRYTRALKQIKDATLDEKLKLLEEIPTNNTTGLYTDVPGFPAPEITVPGDIDSPLDLEEDGQGQEGYTGNDTTGLFESDGTIRAVEPPGDTSYVLGPMMSMWYAWGNFTQIGYVRQSDRRMVNLARITGELSAWDGASNFTSYGQLTVEQAVWFQGQTRQDYQAFYPGPPSNPADEYGRYTGSIVAESKPTERVIPENPNLRYVDGTGRPADPSDTFSLMMDRNAELGDLVYRDPKALQDYINSLSPEEADSQLFDNSISMYGDTDAAAASAEYNIGREMASSVSNPNLAGRTLRSATDTLRYSGDTMFQGNPAGRAPGLSNYWSPDPATAGTYSRSGSLKGVPGASPSSSGTLTTAQRPPGTPRVTRSPLGQPQFKFPKGSPPPGKMITQMADSAAVSAGRRAAATTVGKTISRAVPIVSIGIAAADAGYRASQGDYAGAVLSGISAVPGPIGWAALGVQIATDAVGATGVREEQEFNNYGDYLENARKVVKKNDIKIDSDAMLDLFLRGLSKESKLSNHDKEFLVAIFTDAEGLEKDDVVSFVDRIQDKLLSGKRVEEGVHSVIRRNLFEQATGGGTITAHTDAGDVTITIPPKPPVPPQDNSGSGMQTTPEEGLPTDFSKSTLEYLRGQESEYFVAGYIKGTAAGTNGAAELEKMFTGTTVSWYQVVRMVDEVNEIDKAKTEANVRRSEIWNEVSPQITSLLSKLDAIPKINRGGELYVTRANYNLAESYFNEIDRLFARHDEATELCYRLSRESLDASKRLGLYVKSGKLVDVDPFKLNDPTIKKEKELDEEEINKLIAELKKAASDAQRSALLNKLKAFGYGALLAAGAIVGFKLLTGAAGINALGAPLVNLIKRLAPKVTKTPVSKPPVPKPSGKPFQNASDDFIRAITDPKNYTRANDAVSKAPKGFKNDVGIQINIGGKTQTVNAADILRFKGFQVNSHQPSGKVLTESQKRILRDIKKPVQVKEMPTKFKVKPTGRKNKTVGADMMKIPDTPNQYKPPAPNIWASKDRQANIRASQEKKNEVLELVGAAEHHWTYLTEESRRKKQEKVNEMMSAEYDKQMELLYEKYRMKEAKITKAMSTFRKPTDVAPEYPKDPPPQLDPETGMHPKYGKKYKHDKLDPHSAEAMPPTGDPVIDANVKKATNAKEKARKLKVLMGKTKRG